MWASSVRCWREEQPTVSAKDFLQGGGRGGEPRLRPEPQHPLLRGVPRAVPAGARTPRSRNAAQYLRDVLDHFGTEPVQQHPAGPMRRFKLFDLHRRRARWPGGGPGGGPERASTGCSANFVRAGAGSTSCILLHGPNGSAKSTFVDALKRGMEHYSPRAPGRALPLQLDLPLARSWSRAASASATRVAGSGELTTYAHLDEESVEVRMPCELRDHPLFLMPRDRAAEAARAGPRGPARSGDGEASARRLPARRRALPQVPPHLQRAARRLPTATGCKVLRHVQVERFYVSRRYQVGAVTVEPQLSVDAGLPPGHRGPLARRTCPAALQNAGAVRAARRAGRRPTAASSSTPTCSSARSRPSSTCSAPSRPARCRSSTSCSSSTRC